MTMMRPSDTNFTGIIYFPKNVGRLSLDQHKQSLGGIAQYRVPGMCYIRERVKRPVVVRSSVKITIYACTYAECDVAARCNCSMCGTRYVLR